MKKGEILKVISFKPLDGHLAGTGVRKRIWDGIDLVTNPYSVANVGYTNKIAMNLNDSMFSDINFDPEYFTQAGGEYVAIKNGTVFIGCDAVIYRAGGINDYLKIVCQTAPGEKLLICEDDFGDVQLSTSAQMMNENYWIYHRPMKAGHYFGLWSLQNVVTLIMEENATFENKCHIWIDLITEESY